MKEDCNSVANPEEILRIINEYSSFGGFPIYFDNEKVNTVRALWAMGKDEITDSMYTDFYKYIANAFDEPLFTLHFQTDAPIELKSLFFVGGTNMEKMGMQVDLVRTLYGSITSASILESLGKLEASPQLHCWLKCQVRSASSKNSRPAHDTPVQEIQPMQSTAGVTMVEPQA